MQFSRISMALNYRQGNFHPHRAAKYNHLEISPAKSR